MKSPEANALIYSMVNELSKLKYGYRIVVEGCYDTLIDNYKLKKPAETKAEIVDKVIEILNGTEYSERTGTEY